MPSFRIGPRSIVVLTALAAASCADVATEPSPAVVEQAPTAQQAIDALVSPSRAGCGYGTLPSGSLIEICAPGTWNGSVLFYAHGYVEAGQPLEVPDDVVGGSAVAEIVRGLGFIYASTSYRDNGLVAADAARDLEELAALVQSAHPTFAAAPAYLAGVSEGGLATALAMQNPSTRFDGALAMCGPYGSFPHQIQYLGDFRVIFDYFFPGVLPGGPFDPTALTALQPDWEGTWEPAIRAAVASGGALTQQLWAVTRVAPDPADPGQTAADILWYNAFGTPDAIAKLGGLAYTNALRVYTGSQNDALLNASVARFTSTANPTEVARYDTNGMIERPTVALHTNGDQIIPPWNLVRYRLKAVASGDQSQLLPIAINRYGHCNFTVAEVLVAFAVLVSRVGSQQLVASAELFASPAEEAEFLGMARAHGARPTIARGELQSRR